MYSVFNPRGEKIADCGSARDATTLVGMRNSRWDGHYYQYKPDYQMIDLEPFPQNQLPPNQKYIGWENMNEKDFDIEFVKVGGQKIPTQQKLPQSEQEPFIPNFHD